MPTQTSPVPNVILERFAKLKSQGRLAHAYLFVGPNGIGKSETALAVAKLMNCLDPSGFRPGCNCVSCHKIGAGNHPDIHIVVRDEEEKTVITAEQMRDLINRLELRAMEGTVKVAIIKEADELSVDGANIFLKTLEEPNRDTLLILTTAAPERLLPTVTSRCHQVFFFPMGNMELARWVQNEYHTGSLEAGILAHLSQGSPGRARELGLDLVKVKNDMVDRFILARADNAVIKEYCADKESSRAFLEVVLSFFRDVLFVKRGLGVEFLVHADRVAELKKLANNYSEDDLGQIIGQTLTAIRGIRENMNVKVAVTLLKEMI
jgi:DNA polymerase-3 subunit delta'